MRKPKVVTVTLNPTLERTIVTHFLALGYRNTVTEPARLDAAGHGLNIARACHHMICDTNAIIVLGNDPTAKTYLSLLEAEPFDKTVLPIASRTNTETVIYDTGHQNETRILECTAEMTSEDIDVVAQTLKQLIQPNDYVVFAGELPNGAPIDTYAHLTDAAQVAGAKVVLVTEGRALEHALHAQPELVMMTNSQLEAYFNYPIRTSESVIASANKLQEAGALRVLIVNDEYRLAILVDEEQCWFAGLPEEARGTSSGVWDALLAGYLTGRVNKRTLDKSLELGAAAAAYTIDHVGNEFGTLKEVKSYQDVVDVTSVDEVDTTTHP
ncbi:MAG: hypothetical protein CUN55_06575 [Phototrophicales bacterium]|nr:MAG: hypothetical protein CUN55_06575 [Phototrophicales bacterium]